MKSVFGGGQANGQHDSLIENSSGEIRMSLNRRSVMGRLAFGLGALFTKGKFAAAAGLSAAAPQMDQGTAQARRSAGPSIPGVVGGYIRPGTIELVHQQFELVVVGGGLS